MIDEFKYGSFRVDKKLHHGDMKIINGKVKHWESRDKFTLKREDIEDILACNPAIVIIGIGATGLMKIPDELMFELKKKGIKTHVEKTMQACNTYNKYQRENKMNVHAVLCATC